MATQERLIIESLFNIVDKDMNDVPFILNPTQAKLDSDLTGRDIIPKARQLGISAYFLARYTAKCLSKKNTRAVIISHDKESTQRMLAKVHYYLSHIRGPKAVIKNASKNELTFPKTNSMFYIGTAGSRKFGRGDTITDLHCSEAAFWEDPKTLTAGLFQAVPRDTGEIAIESTGNGVGNWYHRQCTRASSGIGRFRLHFFNWLWAPEYSVPVSDPAKFIASFDPDLNEPDLYKQGLSVEQLAFRREKLEELDYDLRLFKQEYPFTLDECFQGTGFSFFSVVNYKPERSWIRDSIDSNLWYLYEHYKHKHSSYAIGVDVSGGVGRDRSVIEVFDIHTFEQVAEWVNDKISPDRLARKVMELGRHFNDAFIVTEINNHGAVTQLKLNEGFSADNISAYSAHRMYQNEKGGDTLLEYGFKTNVRTKPLLIGELRRLIIDIATLHSPLLKDELNTFIETETGKLEAREGCFDDRVIGTALALLGCMTSPDRFEKEQRDQLRKQLKDPFQLEGLLEELQGRFAANEGDYPIPHQDAESGNLIYLK